MKSNKNLIILIIFLLLTNYLMVSKIDQLENRIANLGNSVYRLDDGMNRISGDISRSLNEFKVENSWTRKARASASRYNEEEQTATVHVEVAFNELRIGEKIYIHVQESEGSKLEKIDVTPALNNGLNLDYTLNLSIDHDYALSVVGESTESKRSVALEDIALNSMIRKFLIVDSYGWQVEADESEQYKSVGIDIIIHSYLEKNEFIASYFQKRQISDIYGEVYVDDVLFDSIDFLHDEAWQVSGIEMEDENKKTELSVMNKGTLPIFEFGVRSPDDLTISGVYTFDKPVRSNREVTFFIIFKDKQGDEYRYPLSYIFS